MSSIYTEYFQLTAKYKSKYGPETIVLLQVGAFFEVYGIKNTADNNISGSQIADFTQICNLNMSEKKTSVSTMSENEVIIMAGFRDYTLEKYLQKLTENHYCVVVYVQEKDGKNIKRVFHSVHSAGTFISFDIDSSPQTSNNIMCVWFDTYKSLKTNITNKDTIIYGVAVVNIFTGKSSIFEYQTAFLLNPTTFDELERYVSVYSPCEMIFISPEIGRNGNILHE